MADILEKAFVGDDCKTFQLRNFFGFSLELATRGHLEQKALKITDFSLGVRDGMEVLIFIPSGAMKNYTGSLKDKRSMVRMLNRCCFAVGKLVNMYRCIGSTDDQQATQTVIIAAADILSFAATSQSSVS